MVKTAVGALSTGRAVAVWLVLVLVTTACGGRVAGDDGGAGPGEGPGSGADPQPADEADSGLAGDAAGPWDFPVCPPYLPQVGSGCSMPGQGCRYKDLTLGTCEAVACTAEGLWRNAPEGCP